MPNRLARETSPYLLQHAHNPVDWYPWGPEALERARTRGQADLPLASATPPATGATSWSTSRSRTRRSPACMNEHFVCIKVDREERPDLDEIYMTAVQAMTGPGRLADDRLPHARPASRSTAAPTSRPTTATAVPGFADAPRPRRRRLGRASASDVDEPRARADAARRCASADAVRRPGDARTRRRCGMPRASASGASTRACGGFGGAPKFPHAAWIFAFLLRSARAPATPTRCRWRRTTLDAHGRAAASTTSSAAASTATAPTSAGSCRTSRRCSTTTRCSPSPTSRPGRPHGRPALSPRRRRRRSTTSLREMTSPEGGF